MPYKQQGGVDTVELNEITNIKGDADLAYGGTPGGTDAIIPFNQGIQYLANASRLKAEADQFKYLEFQKNLKDFYAKFDDIKVDGLMEADYPIINKEYADLARDIANNYDVIRNPNKDPEKFAQLKEREAQLRGSISRSKQDLAYRDAHDKFVQANPDFNTETNKARIRDFSSKTIGERQLYDLDTPFVYNPNERAKIANTVAQQKLKAETTNGRYFTTEEQTQYLQDEYDKAWDATAAVQDKTGRPVRDAAADVYTKLYGADAVKNDFANIDRQMGRSLMLQDDKSSTMKEDQYGLQNDRLAHDARQQAANRDAAKDKSLEGVGRDYNEAIGSAFTSGTVRGNVLQATYGDNNEVEVTKTEGGVINPATGITPPKTERKVKVPKVIVTGSSKGENGKLIITRVDGETGAPLPAIERTYEQAREDFKNLSGPNNAARVADAAERYRKDHGLDPRAPNLPEIQKHFKLTDTDKKVKEIKGL